MGDEHHRRTDLGNAPSNLVGIEVDLVHVTGPTTGQTKPQNSNNYTAFWAQADGDGVNSSAALYVSKTARSTGWNYLAYTSTDFSHWMMYLQNTKNDANARGILVDTSFGGTTGRVFEARTNGNVRFYIDGSSMNPVHMLLGGTVSNIQTKDYDDLTSGDQVLVAV